MTRAAKGPKPPAPWKAHVGAPPLTVTVYERVPGGPLWMRWWDREAKTMIRVPLKHYSRERAVQAAEREHARLAHGVQAMTGAPVVPGAQRDRQTGEVAPTVAGAVALYLAQRTPQKKTRQQRKEDERRGAMWTRLFGTREVRSLDDTAWNQFVAWRRSGAVTARGEVVTDPAKMKPCGPRGVDADLVFILSVFNWCCQLVRPTPHGPRPVLERNPWAGAGPGAKRLLARPKAVRVRRPIATTARYEALLAVAGRVTSLVPRLGAVGEPPGRGAAVEAPSYFGVLLTLAYHTGRRIEAIVRLRWGACVRGAAGDVVAITWPPLKDEDETTVPVRAEVTAALRQHEARWRAWAAATGREVTADAPLFPALRSWARGRPLVPISRFLARDWLERAEQAAELEHLAGGGWHPFRRSWATRRKGVPTADAMAAAGWKDRRTFERAYQHADAEGVRLAIEQDARLE